MCSRYQAIKERERYRRHIGVELPADWVVRAAADIAVATNQTSMF